jgi:hypothetical protein
MTCSTRARTLEAPSVDLALHRTQVLVGAAPVLREVLCPGRVLRDHLALARVGRIAHTAVSLPCNSSGSTLESCTLPEVATTR